MGNSLNYLANSLLLRQSELFGEQYEKFEIKQIHSFNDLSVSDLDDWRNSILNKYSFLNEMQINNFDLYLAQLFYVLKEINPEKLKIKVDSILEENELLLWRESENGNGISKLVFDKYGQIVYMYNGNDGKKIKGIFNNDVDMQKLLFKFLSH